ncbi:cell filamentation protein [Paenibacillus sp. SORGH_AS306]|uniref:protein adenylyltransferase n=1 Tax=Paenibacillus kyungheensis TaxID=1452732 RepID=A0AAX3M6B8_9BACL|nr:MULTISPECIES: Fic family protein [Paenibacillus]MDQ1233959.1 cell filamentation protein [Paenibacillus sp. SORGH_AS_0306]MDR6111004.1 cell filamentation protein [Paenibacillus sp. SORGH_AS_0338]WCT57860.1 Fic family protein [Paenibacillus kyungheensis]
MSRYNHQQSSYCYPGTDILKNKENIRDVNTLERYERMMSSLRNAELYKYPVAGHFDIKHMQNIHHYLFRDIYSFAGKFRTEDISKDGFVFALSQYIPEQIEQLFQQLKEEQYLIDKSVDFFVIRAAHYMAEINVIHPFREGNGRMQREFIRCLARYNGYILDWNRTDPQQLLHASISSVIDISELSNHIHNCLENKEHDFTIANEYKSHM